MPLPLSPKRSSPHARHVGETLPSVGKTIDDALTLDGERAHFLVLAWVDGVVQMITNTPREGVIEILRHHLTVLENDTLQPGVAP